MGKYLKALGRAAKAFVSANDPRSFKAGGEVITCSHCGNKTFTLSKALLNSRTFTFVDLDWLDDSASVLVCTNCSRLEWFGKEPDEVE